MHGKDMGMGDIKREVTVWWEQARERVVGRKRDKREGGRFASGSTGRS
jgi:hypothetical protein